MKNKLLILSVGIVIFIGIAFVFYYLNNKSTPNNDSLENNESEIISREGLHWHSELSINVGDKKVEIPPNVGLGTVHNSIHTHDEDAGQGVIHLEFPGLVRYEDTRLGEFFRIWGKDINSFGSDIKMTVNGVENIEFENYLMKDGDKIVLTYN